MRETLRRPAPAARHPAAAPTAAPAGPPLRTVLGPSPSRRRAHRARRAPRPPAAAAAPSPLGEAPRSAVAVRGGGPASRAELRGHLAEALRRVFEPAPGEATVTVPALDLAAADRAAVAALWRAVEGYLAASEARLVAAARYPMDDASDVADDRLQAVLLDAAGRALQETPGAGGAGEAALLLQPLDDKVPSARQLRQLRAWQSAYGHLRGGGALTR